MAPTAAPYATSEWCGGWNYDGVMHDGFGAVSLFLENHTVYLGLQNSSGFKEHRFRADGVGSEF